MKKIALLITAVFVILASVNTNAQGYSYKIPTKSTASASKTTLTNTDTAYATLSGKEVENHVQAFRAVVTKTSGNVSSIKVYLQGRIGAAGTNADGTWDDLDSLTCTDQTTNKKQFEARKNGKLLYVDYRLFFKGGGTAVSTVDGYQIRRRDD